MERTKRLLWRKRENALGLEKKKRLVERERVLERKKRVISERETEMLWFLVEERERERERERDDFGK